MTGFLAKKGRRVLANGYGVIPIIPNDKAPSVKGWQNVETTPQLLKGWLANGKASHGLGIPTRWTPLVDIDVLDTDGAEHMANFVLLRHNFPPIRIGQWPKRGILFRSETPFRKKSSRWYIDDKGRECHVEILGDGQQFVAYHIHPTTKKPYRWLNDGPDNTPRDELEVLTEEAADEIIAEFHRYAELRGWKPKTTGTALAKNSVSDELSDSNEPIGLTDDELRNLVRKIPNNDAPYEGEGLTWLNIMAAIHHETGGSDTGEEIAYEWSDRSWKHTDERFNKTWNSFHDPEERKNVTARLLVKLAKEAEEQQRKAQIAELMQRMDFARDLDELKAVATEFRKIDLDLLDRPRIVAAFRKTFHSITNANIGVREATALIRYRPNESGGAPDWLEGWCYLKQVERFYSQETDEMLKTEAFNAAFGRYAPDGSAAQYALNTIKIPVHHMRMYLPNVDRIFTDTHGRSWVNSYSEKSAPPLPSIIDRAAMRAIERVENHGYNLFSNERDVGILHSFLAYITQTKDRINWALILHGAQKIGKTTYAPIASAALGNPHVFIVDTEILYGRFTGWAENHLLVFIEELKAHGHNRYQIYDRLKPYITNRAIPIERKGLESYNVTNTSSYIAATNHEDCLPLGIDDTRYFVMMSRFQTDEMITEFLTENPGYFHNLYNAIANYPGAIRKWLLDYRLHPDFDPVNRAPWSEGRQRMIEGSKVEEQYLIEDMIHDKKHCLVSDEILVVHILKDLIADDMGQIPDRINRSFHLRNLLSSMGFVRLDASPRIDGVKHFCWSKKADIIAADAATIRNLIEKSTTGTTG